MVGVVAAEERIGVALLDDPSIPEDHHTIRASRELEAVGDHDRGPPAHDRLVPIYDLGLGRGIERAGRFIQPKEPNQLALDPRIFRHYGDQIEIERAYTLAEQPGKLRFLVFRNVARMARYQDALDLAAQTGGTPDINAVRTAERVKRGFGFNFEQEISSSVGLFGRASRADGQTETYAFTEIDRSLSGGVSVKGGAFGRAADSLGIAYVRNALSTAHRDYLAAGGLGFFLGDGALSYRPENILEAYYSLNVAKDTLVSADFQRISNPGYNADRGPATVVSARLHYGF